MTRHKHKHGSRKILRKLLTSRIDLLEGELELANRIGKYYVIDSYLQWRRWINTAIMEVVNFRIADVDKIMEEFSQNGYDLKKGIRRIGASFPQPEQEIPVIIICHGDKVGIMENINFDHVQY